MVSLALAGGAWCVTHTVVAVAVAPPSIPHVIKHYLVRGLEEFWKRLSRTNAPPKARDAAGHLVHTLIRRYQEKTMAEYTRFFRNTPQLHALAHLVRERGTETALRVAVLGCSTGAEVYSVVWALRDAIPELDMQCVGLDVSESVVRAARSGVYATGSRELEGVSAEVVDLLFDRQGDSLVVKESLRKGVTLLVGDACSTQLSKTIGLQDIVIANNFLIHLPNRDAATCLRRISDLVTPGGALIVWGVDLDIKTRVMRSLQLEPLPFNWSEIYEADRAAREAWPVKWWGLEPLDQNRSDRHIRYCGVFRKPVKASPSSS